MARIYSPPKEIPTPAFNPDTWQKDDEAFEQKLRAYCLAYGSGECKGEVISFPVADGYARYMVFSLRPVALIHMPLGDSWQFQYANRLTAADIKEQVRKSKFLKELFSRPQPFMAVKIIGEGITHG